VNKYKVATTRPVIHTNLLPVDVRLLTQPKKKNCVHERRTTIVYCALRVADNNNNNNNNININDDNNNNNLVNQ
jgi:hypothetical protein